MTDHPDGHGPDDPRLEGPDIGPLAEEAAKLLGALSDWARDQGGQVGHAAADGAAGLAGHAARFAADAEEHLATGAPECTWCPVCRTLHTVRQLSPEVRAHLATAAVSLAQAAAGILATVPEQQSAGGQRTGEGAGRSDRVERIQLDEEDR